MKRYFYEEYKWLTQPFSEKNNRWINTPRGRLNCLEVVILWAWRRRGFEHLSDGKGEVGMGWKVHVGYAFGERRAMGTWAGTWWRWWEYCDIDLGPRIQYEHGGWFQRGSAAAKTRVAPWNSRPGTFRALYCWWWSGVDGVVDVGLQFTERRDDDMIVCFLNPFCL